MQFEITQAINILERTPSVIKNLLWNLPNEWTSSNEGNNTWSPFDVVGHLIHGEKTDWIPRTEIILKGDPEVKFSPFDRFAQYEISQGKTINELIIEFEELRKESLNKLSALSISNDDLKLEGSHPELGKVTLNHLLSAWVVHDLGHIAQISRVMAKQYSTEIGPWHQFMGIMK